MRYSLWREPWWNAERRGGFASAPRRPRKRCGGLRHTPAGVPLPFFQDNEKREEACSPRDRGAFFEKVDRKTRARMRRENGFACSVVLRRPRSGPRRIRPVRLGRRPSRGAPPPPPGGGQDFACWGDT